MSKSNNKNERRKEKKDLKVFQQEDCTFQQCLMLSMQYAFVCTFLQKFVSGVFEFHKVQNTACTAMKIVSGLGHFPSEAWKY